MGDSLLSHSVLHFCTNTRISRENLLSKEGMGIDLKLNLKRLKPKYPYAFMYDAIHPHFLYIRMNSGKPSHELLCFSVRLYMYVHIFIHVQSLDTPVSLDTRILPCISPIYYSSLHFLFNYPNIPTLFPKPYNSSLHLFFHPNIPTLNPKPYSSFHSLFHCPNIPTLNPKPCTSFHFLSHVLFHHSNIPSLDPQSCSSLHCLFQYTHTKPYSSFHFLVHYPKMNPYIRIYPFSEGPDATLAAGSSAGSGAS